MFRLDRMASLYIAQPISRLISPVSSTRVPVLMYHSISENLFGMSHPYYQINTTPKAFARQMRWLRQNGYHTLDLQDLQKALIGGRDLSKAFVVTFDDGYRDFYTDGFEAMKQCGFTATIFLATDRIRNTSMRIEGVDYLTWNEVRELHKGGISLGSHTVTHPDLRSLGPDQIEYELGYSKESIEQEIGAPVATFAYPFAFPEEDKDFGRFLAGILENLGFETGVTTIIGRATRHSNRFYLPRLPVNTWDDPALLRAKLEGGYDWLHIPQWLNKVVHHNVTLMQKTNWAEQGE
jgi:peptidoglycan/xylan/chitin deacetylase (PgdA/CDA1 family)